jgi:putative sigma-54 modulation protein
MVVRIDIQKMDHTVDIVMKFSHFKINVHAVTDEMYSAIDKAFDKLRAKIRRWKGKIQDHHAKGTKVIDLEVNVLKQEPSFLEEINDAIDEANLEEVDKDLKMPVVHKTKTRRLKHLTLSEAVMKMELSHDNFLIYRSEEDLKMKVLYRRKDNSYGVISLQDL